MLDMWNESFFLNQFFKMQTICVCSTLIFNRQEPTACHTWMVLSLSVILSNIRSAACFAKPYDSSQCNLFKQHLTDGAICEWAFVRANYLPLIFSTKEVYFLCPSIVIRTTIFMNAIIKMGKPLALISTLHSRKAFSFI